MPDDLHPHFTRPAWNDKRSAPTAGRAESGPRRAPSGIDDSLATVRAIRAEAVDGLALTLAMIAMAGGRVDSPAARRAYRWATTLDTVRASTVRMMGHDSTVPASAATDRRAYAPTSVERLPVDDRYRIARAVIGLMTGRWVDLPVTVRLWNESGPVNLSAAGGGRRALYGWIDRHGWQADSISRRQAGRAAGLSDTDAANVARTVKHFTKAAAMLAEGTVPQVRSVKRGRPAGWQAALAYLLATGRIDRADVPAWIATDVTCPTGPIWEAAAQAAA
jgi:hypothetical protein